MLRVYVDAASKGEEGPSAGGIVLLEDNNQKQIHLSLGGCSNHEAEFRVFIYALELLIKYKKEKQTIIIYSDSRIVIDTFEKQYTKNEVFKQYLQTFQELAPIFSLLLIKWVPERQNKGADTLAKQALLKYDKKGKYMKWNLK